MKKYEICILLILIFARQSCNQNNDGAQGDWIKGTPEEKIKTIEKQFRGFDNAMVETGYRFQELYWAGKDNNWDYAKYQLEKMKIAVEYGLERRPNRAKSAELFLNNAIPEMQKSVDSKDTVLFNRNFQMLMMNCNSCHALEKVPFFEVKTPESRQSPIRK